MEKKKRIRIVLMIAVIICMILGGWKYGEYRYTSGHTTGYYEGYDKGYMAGSTKGYENGKATGYDIGYAAAQKNYSQKQITVPVENSSNSREMDYIVNGHTGKFHYPDCSYIQNAKSTNLYNYTGTRDQLIEWGYSPCQKCNP